MTALIWAAVIIYWQETHRQVTAGDVGVYLIALPLVAVISWYVARGIFRWAVDTPAPESVTAPQDGSAAAAKIASLEAQERGYLLAIRGSAVHSAAGQSAEEILAALKEQAVKPESDPDLQDSRGFTIRSARVVDLDTTEIEDWWASYDESVTASGKSLAPAPQFFLRALALLQAPLAASLDMLAQYSPLVLAEAKSSGGTPNIKPGLIVAIAAPSGLEEAQKIALRAYVEEQLSQLEWPQERITITLLAPSDGTAIIQLVDRYSVRVNREGLQDILLLLGSDSFIDENLVVQLEAEQRLHTSEQLQGIVPGEAAAAVIFTPPGLMSAEPPAAFIHRAALGLRDKSADAGGRITPDLVCALAEQALVAGNTRGADIAGVVTDCDHRSSRVIESAGMMNQLLTELDPITDRVSLGDALGHVGAAGTVLLLALAAERAKADEKPNLLMAIAHPTERAVFVVRHQPESEAAPAATPAAA